MKSGIYLIRNKVNGKEYVGQSEDMASRWKAHRSSLIGGYHGNPHLQRAWNKYGRDSFEFLILVRCQISELDDREVAAIYERGLTDQERGYNCTSGGGGIRGFRHSDEAKRKISEASKGNKHSLGRKLTEDHKRRITEHQTGKKRGIEFVEKLRLLKTGLKHSAETKEKIKALRTGTKLKESTKVKLGYRAKNQWSDPDFRDKMLKVLAENRRNRWSK